LFYFLNYFFVSDGFVTLMTTTTWTYPAWCGF